MPQRAVLTEEQRAALLALPEGEPELVRHWTLGADDLRAIVSGRRPHDRFGFAVQLCALRYPGRLLRPGKLVSHAPLAFVADQLDVDPEVLADYASRGPTRYEQLDTLRDVFGFRQLSRPARAELQTWLLPVALTTTSGAEFARMLLAEFRSRQIIVPGVTLVERMVAQALLDAERHVAELLTRNLTPGQRDMLDALLGPYENTKIGVLAGYGSRPESRAGARSRPSSTGLAPYARLSSTQGSPWRCIPTA